MASSLASIAETQPENVLPQWQQKLLTQTIRLDRIIYLRPNGFSARSAIFCRYWTCSFSGRNNQAIGAEVVCHFLLFVSMSFVISRFCFRFVEMVAAKILHNCELSK